MKEPTISIILPVYNVEKYLVQNIESILAQDYMNFEAIFVNDGSTDRSAAILARYKKKDSRIKVFTFTSNKGVSKAKNFGIRKSIGKYICFIDPDDYVSPDYLSSLLSLVQKNDADIALSDRMINAYGKNTDGPSVYFSPWGKTINGRDALVKLLEYRMNIGVSNKIFLRNIIKKHDIFFYDDLVMGEGFNFNAECFASSKKIAVTSKAMYYYRRDNNDSATTHFTILKWENAIAAVERIRQNLVNANDDELMDAWKFAYWRTNVDAFVLLYMSGNSEKNENFRQRTLFVGKKYWRVGFKYGRVKDKVRALCVRFIPNLLPALYIIRRKILGMNIKN